MRKGEQFAKRNNSPKRLLHRLLRLLKRLLHSKHTLGVSHTSMSVFLDWLGLQRYQFQVQCRLIQLATGRPARERKATYVQMDKNIAAAKQQYGMSVGSIFCYQFSSSFCPRRLSRSHIPVPPLSTASQSYSLRRRTHSYQLPGHSTYLSDCNFLTRMLYKNSY